MSLDHELFIRDAIEKAIKENPDYDNLDVKVSVEVDGNRVIVREGVESLELLR
mgnify:CR=1 FL=1